MVKSQVGTTVDYVTTGRPGGGASPGSRNSRWIRVSHWWLPIFVTRKRRGVREIVTIVNGFLYWRSPDQQNEMEPQKCYDPDLQFWGFMGPKVKVTWLYREMTLDVCVSTNSTSSRSILRIFNVHSNSAQDVHSLSIPMFNLQTPTEIQEHTVNISQLKRFEWRILPSRPHEQFLYIRVLGGSLSDYVSNLVCRTLEDDNIWTESKD